MSKKQIRNVLEKNIWLRFYNRYWLNLTEVITSQINKQIEIEEKKKPYKPFARNLQKQIKEQAFKW